MENKEITTTQPLTVTSLSDNNRVLNTCNQLADFIKKNNLSSKIQGKDYVNVEGWQYAGAQIGIIPIVQEAVNISTADELKYSCKVELKNIHNGMMVGAGVAICSNKEQGKKFYQEYAIASMAQTRAVGKAYRTVLSWMIKAAGFEPTPQEEMDYMEGNKITLEVDQIRKMINGASGESDLELITSSYPEINEARKLLVEFANKQKSFKNKL